MKIEFKKLTGQNAAPVSFSEAVDLSGETLFGEKPFQRTVQISGEVTGEQGVLRLRGMAKTIYSTGCARCLKPLDILLSAEVDSVLSDDPEAEEEDDLFVLTGDTVDPADVLIPALFLQVEMVYLCKDDCKGLCPHCGVDQNVAPCDCQGRQIDPRFAALRALLNSDEDK